MLNQPSPYHRSAANLRENGFNIMPVWPGKKIPGAWDGAKWGGLPGWAKYCNSQPPEFLHDKWEAWPEAGVCVAHGNIIGLDLDTDRKDVAEALHKAITPPEVRRRGAKGWLGYYRPGEGLDGLTARVRWYDKDGGVVVEVLLHGTQSVLPPTIHPDTQKPYTWLTDESLESTDISELPVFSGTDMDALDREFTAIGLTRQAPRQAQLKDYDRPSPSAHDLEKPFGRSLNDRAMESAAIDQWWPALDMPKSRQRGAGAWEAVPWWRASGSGRAPQDRNPNLKAVPNGIVDFGADRAYTPVDVVMASRDCTFEAAADWLGQFVRPEAGTVDLDSLNSGREKGVNQNDALESTSCPEMEKPTSSKMELVQKPDQTRWAATPVFAGTRSYGAIKPVSLPSKSEWDALLPDETPPFPIQSFDECEGLLGDVARHIDQASATHTEAGAWAVTLPLLGAAMGRAYETNTKLRTNVYTVALGGSGSGKTSLVSPAKELMRLAQIDRLIGTDRIASGSGLIQMLSTDPCKVCFLDEFGHTLQQINSFGAGTHAKQIITEFTALYSAAWTLFTGTAYATREPSPIDCPHLCLFGMATPDQFWSAFGSSAMEDGSIARYLIFPLGKTGPKDPNDSMSQGTADAIKAIQAAIKGRERGNLGQSEMCRVYMDSDAEDARDALKQKESAFAEYAEINSVKGGPAILRRVTENATKIALISAVGRDPVNPMIERKDMDIGHAIAWWSANTMITSIASHIADNQIERDVNAVERFIKEGADNGRKWSDVLRKFRSIKSRDLKEITESLEKEGSIEILQVGNNLGGNPVKVLKSSQVAVH
ncbi:bifunctional DNA primase/polymerase [Sulfitobacter pacificus]|uniref:bifunctional DNA primase/polymerase n=1 Tax=Sulfitobacter pacificus TaxID=1499314 RepID=UPI003102C8FB